MSAGGIDEFLRQVGLIVAEYQTPGRNYDPGRDRSIAYGNVRYRKMENAGRVSVGIIYETPGGSTNQINVEVDPVNGRYSIPLPDGEGDLVSDDEEQVLALVREHIEQIPALRRERLEAYVNAKLGEGQGRVAVFQWLNELLYQDLKGGRVTHGELSAMCHYVVEHSRTGYEPGA